MHSQVAIPALPSSFSPHLPHANPVSSPNEPLSLCPCGNFYQLAFRRCVCVCVCVRVPVHRISGGPWCAGQPCPLCEALDSAWKPNLSQACALTG